MTSSLPSGDGTSTGTGPSSALDEDALPGTGTEPDTARSAAGDDQPSASPDVSVAPDTSPSPDTDVVPEGPGAPAADVSGSDTAPSGSGPATDSHPERAAAVADDDAPGDSGAPDAAAAAAPAAPDAAGPDEDDTSTAAGAVEGLNPAQAQDDLDTSGREPKPSAKVELDGPALENTEMRRGTEDLQASEDSIAEAREHAADVRSHTLPGTSPTGL